jgi:hypothetical protein
MVAVILFITEQIGDWSGNNIIVYGFRVCCLEAVKVQCNMLACHHSQRCIQDKTDTIGAIGCYLHGPGEKETKGHFVIMMHRVIQNHQHCTRFFLSR